MIEQFLKYISSVKGYSDNTVVAYGKDLRQFAAWARSMDAGAS